MDIACYILCAKMPVVSGMFSRSAGDLNNISDIYHGDSYRQFSNTAVRFYRQTRHRPQQGERAPFGFPSVSRASRIRSYSTSHLIIILYRWVFFFFSKIENPHSFYSILIILSFAIEH